MVAEGNRGGAAEISKPVPDTITQIKGRKSGKIKSVCKLLVGADEATKREAWGSRAAGPKEKLQPQLFVKLAKHFYKLYSSFADNLKAELSSSAYSVLIERLSDEDLLSDVDCVRFLRLAFERTVREEEKTMLYIFRTQWSNYLSLSKKRVCVPSVAALVQGCVRRSKGSERREWEKFQTEFVDQLGYSTSTQGQSCVISTRSCLPGPLGDFPREVIVWNGNGFAARWEGTKETKQLVDATTPDLFCFMESKMGSDKLLALPGFEEWAAQKGFATIHCYWSMADDRLLRGCEGIIIFSRLPCSVTCGIGDKELDMQARVVTVEFAKIFVLITYHPYGGFAEASLAYRANWEAKFCSYLMGLRKRAAAAGKPVMWAGDFNVNPSRSDWSERAFDPMRKKIPAGATPPGCRPEDVISYKRMLAAIGGWNLANIFANQDRTYFPNEFCLTRNYGQRIDHVVMQESLLGDAGLRVTDFKVMQEFGGGRKGCSDHCPLAISLTEAAGDSQPRSTLKQFKKMATEFVGVAAAKESTDNRPASEAFLRDVVEVNTVDEDYETQMLLASESEAEDACNAGDDENCYKAEDDEICCEAGDGVRAYEDNPMPVLRVRVGDCQRDVRVLIDSGAGVNLVNADFIAELGLCPEAVNGAVMKIKVANGAHASLNRMVIVPLKVGEVVTDPVQFYVLAGLPFDMLIGNPTLKIWEAELSWHRKIFSFQPKVLDKARIWTKWSTFVGQHWRRPIPLMCAEKIKLQPMSQTAVPICKINEREWEGFQERKGLITPCRSKQILTTKFRTSYGYVEDEPAFVLVGNFTENPVEIAKGFVIGELHLRGAGAFAAARDSEQHGVVVGVTSSDNSRRPSATDVPDGDPPEGLQCSGGGHSKDPAGGRPTYSGPDIDKSEGGLLHSTGDVLHVHDRGGAGGGGTGRGSSVNQGDISVSGRCYERKPQGPGSHRASTDEDALNEGVCGGDGRSVQTPDGKSVAPIDWKLFDEEPLKSVDLKELKEQRSPAEVEALARVLIDYKHLLSDGSLDFKQNPKVRHDTTAAITTTEHNPRIFARSRGCNPDEAQEFKKVIDQKIAEGVVEPSKAPWCSNALLVRKDGKLRMVIDYRTLNKITIKDVYPMPRVQDVTDVLGGSQWFTGVDCCQAFHQIPMADERSRDLTTFKGPIGGLYRYRYMPMGLLNAMAVWSRFIGRNGGLHPVLC